jgi:hypothetical protein
VAPDRIADAPFRFRPATWVAPLVALLVLLTQGTASAFTTTLLPDGTSVFVQARGDLSVATVEDFAFPDALPFLEDVAAVSDSTNATNSVAVANIFLTNRSFSITESLDRSQNEGSQALLGGGIVFSVDEAIAYDLSGFLSVFDGFPPIAGDPLTGEFVELTAQLTTADATTVLFRHLQQSSGIEDQRFVLGVDSGFGAPEGSLTGMLDANTEYRFSISAELRNEQIGLTSTPAIGVGSFNLTLVPEPGTALLMGLGLAGLAVVGRSRRTASTSQAQTALNARPSSGWGSVCISCVLQRK